VEELAGKKAARDDVDEAEDEAENGGADDAAAALVKMGEAKENGRDQQAEPDGFAGSAGEIQQPAAIEKFLAEAGGKRDKHTDDAFGSCGGQELADIFRELEHFVAAGLALLEFIDERKDEDEQHERSNDDERARVSAEVLAEVGEGEIVAKDEHDGRGCEGPGGEDVPDVDPEGGLEAGVEEIVGDGVDDGEEESEEPDIRAMEEGKHGGTSVGSERADVKRGERFPTLKMTSSV